MQNHKPDNEDVNEAVEESFPASDPPSYSTPHAEYQESSQKGNRITPGTWVLVAIAVLLFIALISMAF